MCQIGIFEVKQSMKKRDGLFYSPFSSFLVFGLFTYFTALHSLVGPVPHVSPRHLKLKRATVTAGCKLTLPRTHSIGFQLRVLGGNSSIRGFRTSMLRNHPLPAPPRLQNLDRSSLRFFAFCGSHSRYQFLLHSFLLLS
jgi:hypothetical protein